MMLGAWLFDPAVWPPLILVGAIIWVGIWYLRLGRFECECGAYFRGRLPKTWTCNWCGRVLVRVRRE